jgi:hypothetical protein
MILEVLEDRCTPASVSPVQGPGSGSLSPVQQTGSDTLGIPWIDPGHLTLSFAPDGTTAGAAGSTLQQLLATDVPGGAGPLTILRAFQTWAVLANVNIGLVSDGGQPLGTIGSVQGDSRFGDIRIAAVPLGSGTVATGNPFELDGSTWSGDVLLNSQVPFGNGSSGAYDLYTVALHEAGHVFGLADSSDPTSVMYGTYTGPRTGLSAQDVAAFQSLYGARQGDAFQGKQGNHTWQTASPLGSFSTPITADITTLGGVDWYKVAIPDTVAPGATVTVNLRTTGISLLESSLTVYDNAQNVLGAATATSPLYGDLSVQLPNVVPGQLVYLKVSGATQSVFGIGSYQLSMNGQSAASSPLTLPGADNRFNGSLATATRLTARNSSLTTLDFSYQGIISSAADVHYYKVFSPATAGNSPPELLVMVSATNVNGLMPQATVFDASGAAVPAQVIANDHGFFCIQIANTQPNAAYYVEVSALNPSGSAAVGNYLLGLDFNATPTVQLQQFAAGALAAATPANTQTLSVSQSSALQLVLAAGAGTSGVEVQMSIYNANGALVFQLASYGGQPATSGVAYLTAGTYTVLYQVASIMPLASPVSYALQGWTVSDPIDPILVGSTTGTSTPGKPPYVLSTPAAPSWQGPSYLALDVAPTYTTPYYF